MLGTSHWSVTTFGENAPVLAGAFGGALRTAHDSAYAAHVAGGLDTNDTYGTTLAHAQHKELLQAARATGIEGISSVKIYRYHLVTMDNFVFYPVRYADSATVSVAQASLRKPVSEVRRTLFELHGPVPAQISVYEELAEDEWGTSTLEHALKLGLAKDTKVITLAYAANPSAGVINLHWGVAELAQDAHLSWHDQQHEEIPLLLDAGTAPRIGLRAVPDTRSVPSFDQGDQPDIELGIRTEPEQEATGDNAQ